MPDMSETAFADSLAAAAALETSDDDASSGDDVGGADDTVDESTETSDGAAADADDDSADAGEDDDAEADEGEASSDDGLAAVKEKFLAGDTKAALKALGLDPKILDLNDAKFRTMRQGLKAADEKAAEATRLHTEAAAKEARTVEMYERGKRELGPVLQLQRLLGKGDYLAAKEILEAMAPAGTTYKQIAEGMALAAKGMSPSEELYRRRLRELDEREQAAKVEAEKAKEPPKPAASDAGKNLEGAKKMLSTTALADVPGAAEALVRVAAENWDPVKQGLKVPRAKLLELVSKDPVISQLLELKQLKAKGKGKAPAAEPEKKRDTKGRFRERPRAESKLTPEQSAQARKDADFKASVAAAAAMERQERRSAGGRRR